MKRTIICILLLMTAMLLMGGTDVGADEISDIAAELEAGRAADGLDYTAAEFLRENNITPDNAQGITELSPKTVLAYMWEKLKHEGVKPLKTLGMIISVVILSAAVGAFSDAIGAKGTEKVCRTVTVLAAVTVVVPPLEECIEHSRSILIDGGEFMLCYVPVFTGICTAMGNALSGASYNVIVLALAQIAVKFVCEIIFPVISVCVGMSVIDAIVPSFSLNSVITLFKRAVTFLMGLMMTVFTGMITIQSIVGNSADTVGIRAAKFMVSNFVPVVGGAVADAYTTMRSGLGLLRGAAGAFGVIALAVILLPPIIETGCMYLVMSAGEAASQMMGLSGIGTLFKGTAAALSLVLAVLACFGVMFTVSTVILMAAGLAPAG